MAALKAKSKPSRAQYRMMATRQMTGGKRVKVQNTSTQAADLEMIRVDGGAKEEKVQNIVNFKASAYRCVIVRGGGGWGGEGGSPVVAACGVAASCTVLQFDF